MPSISVIKQTVWMTSDGRPHESHAEAIAHEKKLKLASIVDPTTFNIPPRTAAAIVAALLSSSSISIILTKE